MARPFSDLPKIMNRRAKEAAQGADELTRLVAVAIDESLVDGTPVDTGVARSNWVATLNIPFSGTIPAYSPGNKLGIGESGNAGGAKAQARATIQRYRGRTARTIHITNNIDYIESLDNGSSAQAPTGISANAVQIGTIVAQSKKLIK